MYLTSFLTSRSTLAFWYLWPGLYLESAERVTRFMAMPMQSSEFISFHDWTNALLLIIKYCSLINNINVGVSCFVSRLTVKAVAVLLPILGISWIFGVFAVNTHSLPFLYIFAVFNSLQVSSPLQDPFFSKMFAAICETFTKVFFLFFRGSLSSCSTVFSTLR